MSRAGRTFPSTCAVLRSPSGTFDGVHCGHRAVLDAAKAKAAEGGLPMGVMVFEPYPRMFFQPQRPFFRLTGLPRKLEQFAAYGCGFTAVIPFDRALAELTAPEFVRIILAEGFGIKHASVGYNFFFGKGRGGNPGVLAGKAEATDSVSQWSKRRAMPANSIHPRASANYSPRATSPGPPSCSGAIGAFPAWWRAGQGADRAWVSRPPMSASKMVLR